MSDLDILYPTQFVVAFVFAICMLAFPKFLINWGVAQLIRFFEGRARLYTTSHNQRSFKKQVYNDDDDEDVDIDQNEVTRALLWVENVISLLIIIGAMSLLGASQVKKSNLDLLVETLEMLVGYIKNIGEQTYAAVAVIFPCLQEISRSIYERVII